MADATVAPQPPQPPQPLSSAGGWLAPRAARALQPSLSYLDGFFKAADDPWTPATPSGYVVAAVAENRLSSDLVAEGLRSHNGAWDTSMLFYQDTRGVMALRQALATLCADTFMQGARVAPEHITVLAGVGAVLDVLFHALACEGDAVLIPAPYYPAFDNDLQVRNSVRPVPAALDLAQPDLGPGLTAAAEAAAAQGRRVAAVLFTNPTNPEGQIYSRQQTLSIIQWCLAHRVHCISDEIYALSVFDEAAAFTSAAVVAQEDITDPDATALAGQLLHVVFGASKDLCGSGLRVGALLSRNEPLNTALGNLGYFCSVPGPLQMTLASLLSDAAWLQHFLAENRRRLRAAYACLTGHLTAAGIPFTPAVAGMFVMLDLRAAFHGSSTPATWADEDALWQRLMEGHRLVLTPGGACHAAEPGFFRLCWAWPHPDSLPVAVSRIAAALAEHRSSSSSSSGSPGAAPPGS